MDVREIMKRPIKVDKDRKLSDAIKLMEKKGVLRLPVVNDGKLLGVLTVSKLIEKIGDPRSLDLDVSSFHISSSITKNPYTISAEDNVKKALDFFRSDYISILPVVEGEEMVGVITRRHMIPLVESKGTIGDAMTKKYSTLSWGDRVIHARKQYLEDGIRYFAVKSQSNAYIGLISVKDLLFGLYKFRKTINAKRHPETLIKEFKVEEILTKEPEMLDPNVPLETLRKQIVKKTQFAYPVSNISKDIAGFIGHHEILLNSEVRA
ncbi:MAG TPA: CBS domain-containing protein [Methanofastidiosum sp.]|nr:CBS domain-containing protein [Methanofastidiosum sp.]HOR88540.1 CBS domain-containing protein [Methanofastidiosum sp.]